MWSLRMQIVTFRLHTAGLPQSITSIMQLKRRDPCPQRPHHVKMIMTSLLKVLFTTMTNHNVFYDKKIPSHFQNFLFMNLLERNSPFSGAIFVQRNLSCLELLWSVKGDKFSIFKTRFTIRKIINKGQPLQVLFTRWYPC